MLSPQSCFSRSSLRVPLGVSLGLSREAPRTARGTGPPKRTGSLLSANEAVTGPGAQTGKEGGREGGKLRGGKGRGGRWRNRLRRLYHRGRFSVTREIPPTPPARPAEGRLNFAPLQAALSARQRFSQSLRSACRLPAPSPSAGRGEPLTFSTPLLAGSVPNSAPPIGDKLLIPPPSRNTIGGSREALHVSLEDSTYPAPYCLSHRPNKSAPALAGHRIGRLPLALSLPQEDFKYLCSPLMLAYPQENRGSPGKELA
nr:uncharacterized protein LOC111775293 [Equus caballus]